jgi:hypothetical protein
MRRLFILFAFFFLQGTSSADEAAIAAKKRVDEEAVRVWRAFGAGTAPKPEVGREAQRVLEAYVAALPAEKRREARLYTDEVDQMLAKAAWAAGDRADARERAEKVLASLRDRKRDWDFGNLLHEMHILLGRVALEEGDLEKADVHLLRAAATPGSPQLDSFGPDWTLASDLLERGRREAVSAYVLRVEKFWESGRDQIAEWKRVLAAGGTPQFLPKRARQLEEPDPAKPKKEVAEAPVLATPDGLVGVWESTARSKGGIGQVLEFLPDGTMSTHMTVLVDLRYRVEKDQVVLGDGGEGETLPLGTFKADTWTIDVQGISIEKRRIGTATPGAPAIVGTWASDREGMDMKSYERYGADGWLRLRVLLPGDRAGSYERKEDRLTLTADGASVSHTFTIKGDRLRLVTDDEEGEYRYAGKTAWYPLPKPEK